MIPHEYGQLEAEHVDDGEKVAKGEVDDAKVDQAVDVDDAGLPEGLAVVHKEHARSDDLDEKELTR